jgi:hypothetical protein
MYKVHCIWYPLISQWGKCPQKVARAFISTRVVVQIQLVILLGIPPLSCGQDFCNHAALPPLLINLLGNLSRLFFLLGVVVENRAAVLAACVWALAVGCGGVVHLVEELEEGAVGYLFGVVDYLEGFGVWWGLVLASCCVGGFRGKSEARCDRALRVLTSSSSTAYGAVTWVVAVASNVSHARIVQALVFKLPAVHVLDSPEAARGYSGGLRA